jgi:hypothetical protein
VIDHSAAWIKDTEDNLLVIVQLPLGAIDRPVPWPGDSEDKQRTRSAGKKLTPSTLAEGRATGELTGHENRATE